MIIFSTCRLYPICKQTVTVVLFHFLLFVPFRNPPFLFGVRLPYYRPPRSSFYQNRLTLLAMTAYGAIGISGCFFIFFLFLFILPLFFPSLILRCCRLVHVALVRRGNFLPYQSQLSLSPNLAFSVLCFPVWWKMNRYF